MHQPFTPSLPNLEQPRRLKCRVHDIHLLFYFSLYPYAVFITTKPRSSDIISFITLFHSVFKNQRVSYIFNTNVIRHQTIHILSQLQTLLSHVLLIFHVITIFYNYQTRKPFKCKKRSSPRIELQLPTTD